MELITLLEKDITKENIKDIFEAIKKTEFLIPFYENHLIELYTDESKTYIPLYTDESQIKNPKHTRLDKVKIDVVISDIFKNEKYHAISINPDTHDFIMNRKMVNIYNSIINKGDSIMDFKVGLNIVAGKAASGKTSTIVNLVNLESETKKVLFISLETGLEALIERYNLNGRDSVILIDKKTSTEELDKELSNNKYDIVYIDYLMLLQTENNTYKEKINALVEIANKHNMIIVASDYIGAFESVDKYKSDLYQDVATIQVLDMIV